jgi:hypothetical protein
MCPYYNTMRSRFSGDDRIHHIPTDDTCSMNASTPAFSATARRMVRLAALLVAVLVFGFAGLHTGIRVVGMLLLAQMATSLYRGFRSSQSETAGECSPLTGLPAIVIGLLCGIVGVAMLWSPRFVLAALGIPPP